MKPTIPLPNDVNLAWVEDLWFRYLQDPASVDDKWRAYFDALSASAPPGAEQLPPRWPKRSIFGGRVAVHPSAAAAAGLGSAEAVEKARRIERLFDAYRAHGHLAAHIDPLADEPPPSPEVLQPGWWGVGEEDLDLELEPTGFEGLARATVREVLAALRETYCRTLGVEFWHLDDVPAREWLRRRMERTRNRTQLDAATWRHVLKRVTRARTFEEFLQTKFIGAKRFSIEGGEGLIPLIDFLVDGAAEHGAGQVFIGMAHRGRLNVLTHVLEKDPRLIFYEFEDPNPEEHLGSGDVKYHLGFRSRVRTLHGKEPLLSLNFNPSHLEWVCPVVLGRVYSLQRRCGDSERRRVVGLLIHGDASMPGQGVVAETINLSEVEGYATGGTLHVVVNNQIGFTATPREGRSSRYCTGVARQLDAPIFHVNSNDIEALATAARLAADFRDEFGRDVFIDMLCFRRLGHNEGDDPTFTQPLMYARVRRHPGLPRLVARHLAEAGIVEPDEDERIAEAYREELSAALDDARKGRVPPVSRPGSDVWHRKGYVGGPESTVPDVATGVPKERLVELLARQAEVPEGFTPHRGIARLLAARREAAAGRRPLDWGMGEALAFASLLVEGVGIRLDGQDSARGTFSHRHAVLVDHKSGEHYVPLRHLSEDQAHFEVLNSPLSEAAVMGFDYGYSREAPDELVIWEAQFGDFANTAQVIIDQFISAAEDKWGILSGLVLFLPHGFEGQGPEHSSARLERFLALCAQDNMQVCYPTTPAQHFHMLRRQVLRKWRKPLVVMTPKSLLRHKQCISTLDDLATGHFHRVLPDPLAAEGATCRRVILCTGKIFYDLDAARRQRGIEDVAILRLEQLYPLPAAALREALAPYEGVTTDLVWVQEEPWNMGAWYYIRARLPSVVPRSFRLRCISRPESASPATGSHKAHVIEQQTLVDEALG